MKLILVLWIAALIITLAAEQCSLPTPTPDVETPTPDCAATYADPLATEAAFRATLEVEMPTCAALWDNCCVPLTETPCAPTATPAPTSTPCPADGQTLCSLCVVGNPLPQYSCPPDMMCRVDAPDTQGVCVRTASSGGDYAYCWPLVHAVWAGTK